MGRGSSWGNSPNPATVRYYASHLNTIVSHSSWLIKLFDSTIRTQSLICLWISVLNKWQLYIRFWVNNSNLWEFTHLRKQSNWKSSDQRKNETLTASEVVKQETTENKVSKITQSLNLRNMGTKKALSS